MPRGLLAWVRDHYWISAHTIWRRLHVDMPEAERIVRELVAVGALHPRPEGDAYRVRYPQGWRLGVFR